MAVCNYKNIAVMILGPLGDVINTSCVFSQLKKAYPDSDISIITIPAGVAAIKGIPEITKVYVYERNKKQRLKDIIGLFCFARKIRGKFDLMVVLDNTLHAGLISFLSGTPKRVGREGDFKKILLTDTIPYLKEEKLSKIPIKEHYMRCLKPLGLYVENIDTFFKYTDDDVQNVQKIFNEYKLNGRKILGFCPMSSASKKSMRIDDAVAFIDRIKETTDYEVIILGGNDVKFYSDELEKKCESSFVNLVGKTSFTESACIIDKCSKFVSIDTSQMHLAFAMKTPTVAIFFTNIYEKWGPRKFDINRLIVNLNSKEMLPDAILQQLSEISDK